MSTSHDAWAYNVVCLMPHDANIYSADGSTVIHTYPAFQPKGGARLSSGVQTELFLLGTTSDGASFPVVEPQDMDVLSLPEGAITADTHAIIVSMPVGDHYKALENAKPGSVPFDVYGADDLVRAPNTNMVIGCKKLAAYVLSDKVKVAREKAIFSPVSAQTL